ncbi:MAG TPA: HAD family phosphatase [Candidatus Babeliales bacterium]|nr:HAD family phosphatase [Candidatus Babeliales bacterium]
MNYQAIIFDMDGTIIETEHIWKFARNSLVTSRGIPLTPEFEQTLAERLAGTAIHESCAIIKELAKLPDSVEDLVKEKNQIANAIYEDGVRFIEGFLPFHAEAKALNLELGVATNATDQTIAVTNKKLNLTHLFGTHVYGISKVNNKGKPNPAIYLHAAAQLGIEPDKCIAIEDSANGIKAAKAAGMLCIGINTSGNPAQLTEADLIINGYDEIDLNLLIKNGSCPRVD